MNSQLNNTTPEGASRDFFGADFLENPFPALAQLRSLGTIVPVSVPSSEGTQKVWLVTRFEEAVQILKDTQFTVNVSAIGEANVPAAMREGPGRLMGQSLLSFDGLDHRRLCRLVSKAFTPQYIQGLQMSIQRIADELLDRVQDQGRMDIVNDYALQLPITIIFDMLGVPMQRSASGPRRSPAS